MTDPVSGTLAGVGIASSALGSLFGASGAEAAGKAQQQQNNYMGTQAFYNAQVALQNAKYAREQGESSATKYGVAAGGRMGQIKAAQASSGLDVNSGSAVQVQKSQQMLTNMDLDQIRSNAAKTAYNYDVEAKQDQNQGKLYFMAGSNAAQAGSINAEASLISGAGSVASKWLSASQSGAFNIGSANLGPGTFMGGF